MRNKRLINDLAKLIKDYGDVRLSIAINKLDAPPSKGGRPAWSDKQWNELYGGVRAYLAVGRSPMAAYRAYGKFAALSPKTVAMRYVWAVRFFQFLRDDPEMHGYVRDMGARMGVKVPAPVPLKTP